MNTVILNYFSLKAPADSSIVIKCNKTQNECLQTLSFTLCKKGKRRLMTLDACEEFGVGREVAKKIPSTSGVFLLLVIHTLFRKIVCPDRSWCISYR